MSQTLALSRIIFRDLLLGINKQAWEKRLVDIKLSPMTLAIANEKENDIQVGQIRDCMYLKGVKKFF